MLFSKMLSSACSINSSISYSVLKLWNFRKAFVCFIGGWALLSWNIFGFFKVYSSKFLRIFVKRPTVFEIVYSCSIFFLAVWYWSWCFQASKDVNRTGFVGESIFWETIPMTKLKYTPEIRERAVQLLIESEKDYPSTWAAITAIVPEQHAAQGLYSWNTPCLVSKIFR